VAEYTIANLKTDVGARCGMGVEDSDADMERAWWSD
jgi:hypothetical protein